ncbi:MAG TPA: serine/threonine-protein kinase [Acidobacteriota bacterium]|nr:serine/threonine-protein kinase [Acidobacteriota bacterium]
MPGDDDKYRSDSTGRPSASEDPLGIIGWVVGGKYKIGSYVGGGGFGEVYGGYNVNLIEQRVIVKFFKRVQVRDKFDKEARILCMLDHPNISRVIDYLPDEGALVIQYIDGRNGAEVLKETGSLAEDMFLRVARSMTDAVAYAHERKIAHRDIKPANILIDRNDHVYLIDFGIAKEIGGAATKTAYQALTPMFAAPERQAGDRDYNPFLSDIYELGITLFTFATNSMPYRNPVSPNPAEWGGRVAGRLSPQLRRIIKKATHPEPAKRHQSARELLSELNAIENVYHRRRRKPLWAAVIVIALAAAAFLGRDTVRGWLSLGGAEPTASQAERALDRDQAGTDREPLNEPAGAAADTVARDAGRQADTGALTGAATGVTETIQQRPEPPRAAQETTQETTEPVVAPVEEVSPTLRVDVIPEGFEKLLIDDRERVPGRAFDIASGTHQVIVVHPAYPVLRKVVRVSDEQTSVAYDLEREFAGADTVSVQVALYPPTDDNLVEFTLNGRKRIYTQFPVLDLAVLEGDWQISVDVLPVNDYLGVLLKVDSSVTFPYGGGPRVGLAGAAGTTTLMAGENGHAVPLLIYWSEQ